MASPQSVKLKFKLSSELIGHSGDVRAVSYLVDQDVKVEYIVTASRDRTAIIWSRPLGQHEFKVWKRLSVHEGYVSALCIIPPDPAIGRKKHLIATGSQDRAVIVHSLDPGIEAPVAKYVGHTGLISCIIYQNNQLVTSSWDSTVRVWRSSEHSECMMAHKAAAWTLSGLFQFDGTDRALSGGADRVIRLWELPNKLCVQEYHGHTDVVRCVCVISSELFLSASNDCTVRQWNIHSGQCLREFHGHEAFIYSMSVFPELTEDFCTCGEDGTVRVWRAGSCDQVIRLPCISVWNVCCSDNGEIITGSSDGVARVFTQDPSLVADGHLLEEFDSQVTQHMKTKGSQIDVSSLPGMEILRRPGKKDGETKLVNNNERAEIYQWEEDKREWTKLGDAIGQVPEGENMYQGKEYDFVFDIEVDDGGPTLRKLKLPYNKTEDPFIAAQNFLDVNNLPAWQLDQVAEFIMRNTGVSATPMSISTGDPLTGGSRYVPEGTSRELPDRGEYKDPLTSAKKKKNAYFPMERPHSFSSPPDFSSKILRKLKEFSDAVVDCRLNQSQWEIVEKLCAAVSSSSPLGSPECDLLSDLLDWPVENVFPVVDLLRLAVLNEGGNSYFTKERRLPEKVLSLASAPNAVTRNQMLVMRALVNLFSHVGGQQWMLDHRQQVLTVVSELFKPDDKNLQVAAATVVLNYCHSLSRRMSKDHIFQPVHIALQVLKNSSLNMEARFRMLIALGTLCQADKKVVLSVVTVEELNDILLPLCATTDPEKVSQCTLHILELL